MFLIPCFLFLISCFLFLISYFSLLHKIFTMASLEFFAAPAWTRIVTSYPFFNSQRLQMYRFLWRFRLI